VTGSLTGFIFVYDLPSGRLVRRFSTGSDGLVNDATTTPDGDVYATDSRRGLLFHIPAKALAKRTPQTKRLRPFVRFTDTPVGSYSNGVVSAGDRHLLVVGTASGVLGRVDRKTGRVRKVDLGDQSLPGGDGLARSGRTLYAVNAASRVTQVRLSRNWLTGSVVRQITSPSFRFPTTVAIAGRRLLVVNSQFDKRGLTPVLPFTVSAIARP
jgi:Cu-Zn family superoxide dismutase